MDPRGLQNRPSNTKKRSPPPIGNSEGEAEKYKQQRAVATEQSPGGTLTETSKALLVSSSYSDIAVPVPSADATNCSADQATQVLTSTPSTSGCDIFPDSEEISLPTLRLTRDGYGVGAAATAAHEISSTLTLRPDSASSLTIPVPSDNISQPEPDGTSFVLKSTTDEEGQIEAARIRRHKKQTTIFPGGSKHGSDAIPSPIPVPTS
jgi:hypothetical protein